MKKKVLIGLSGGLDSTITAYLLQKQGYEVIGVHFQLWTDDRAEKFSKNLPENKCCSMRDLMLARTVAKKLNIPFYIFDFRERFKKDVVDDFITKFKKGITPNPCVECNRNIKFGYFLEKMHDLGCDFVSTGHYIKNKYNSEKKRWEISGGKDIHKDQTYFLYTLTQEKLQHCLFPMAKYNKDEIREIAKENGFKSFAEKRESQGVCFYAEKSHIPFLQRHIPEAFISGNIIEKKSGKIMGEHNGILHFTKGQRARVGGCITPQYVLDIDITKNIVHIGDDCELFTQEAKLHTLSWTMNAIENNSEINVKIRHGGESLAAIFSFSDENKEEAFLKFTTPIRSITSGQSAVFYSDDGLLLGGGLMY